jgi:molybdenum cofactor cytidylyltransferase
MQFGPVPPREAAGAVLAHSITVAGRKLRKGRVLSEEDAALLADAGIPAVTVARLSAADLPEDAAAERVAAALRAPGLSASAPFTGRVNLFAEAPGILRVDARAVDALNRVDPAITLATLPDWQRVQARQMVATIKIIPYAVARDAVAAATAALGVGTLALHPFRPARADLVLTRTPGMKEQLLRKGAATIEARLTALGLTLARTMTVDHEREAVCGALAACDADLILILGASATSDIADACPGGVKQAGGTITRFGMPVDPGNLLFLGDLGGRPVLGLPGCARSPALNGADWVLERLAAGIAVGSDDIAAMGVGGLLKEIPIRPQPRAGKAAGSPPETAPARPRIAALVLAAGAGRRMRGADKLLEPVAGMPILRKVAEAARASRADAVVAVIPPGDAARRAALPRDGLAIVEAVQCAEGMAGSLRAGMAALPPETDAVVILLADMPEVGAADIDRLIAAYDREEGREICRAVTEAGAPGHPVLFGRRFFENLASLAGDTGAREIVRDAAEYVVDVPTRGHGAVVDLDTPEAWADWRRKTAALSDT